MYSYIDETVYQEGGDRPYHENFSRSEEQVLTNTSSIGNDHDAGISQGGELQKLVSVKPSDEPNRSVRSSAVPKKELNLLLNSAEGLDLSGLQPTRAMSYKSFGSLDENYCRKLAEF